MTPSEKKARAASGDDPPWDVKISRKTAKDLATLPQVIVDIYTALREELADEGPVQPEWLNYGMLKGQKGQRKSEKRYHCHLRTRRDGSPAYVACWKVEGKSIEIEIYYVGPHGRAPY